MPKTPMKVYPDDSESTTPRKRGVQYASETNKIAPTQKAGGLRRAQELVNGFINGGKRVVSEVIGRVTLVRPMWNARVLLNVDSTWTDLKYYDLLRHGMVPGFELGSLYCKPIGQILTSYILGDGISASLAAHAVASDSALAKNGKSKKKPLLNTTSLGNSDPTQRIEYTNAAIRRMMEANQGLFQRLVYDTLSLGDQYVIVNPDCTFSVASPETVVPEYSSSDSRKPIRYIITTKLEKATVKDVYTFNKRTLEIQYYDGRPADVQEYDILIGRIPVVHLSNERGVNEIYGHSIFEPLLPFFRKYDDLFVKTIDGVELIGNPIPVMENLDDPDATIARMSDTEKYTDWQGATQTRSVLRMDRNAVLFLGKGGKASMLGPAIGFTTDSLGVLKALQLLMMHHTRLPEYIFGGAIASSKASVSEQFPPFRQYIQSRRLQFEGNGADAQLNIQARGGILELVDVWLRQYQVLNPAIIVGPTQIEWPPMGEKDDLSNFQWGQYLSEKEYISPEDTIALSGKFDDPDAVYARAQGKTTFRPDFSDLDALLNKELLGSSKEETDMQKSDELDIPFELANSTDFVSGASFDKKANIGAKFNDKLSYGTSPADFWPPA